MRRPIMFSGICRAAVLVKLLPGHKFKIAIGAGQRSLETSMQKPAAGLDHDHASGAAIRMAIGQPEEGRSVSLGRCHISAPV